MKFNSIFILILVLINSACEHEQVAGPNQLQPTLTGIQANILTPKCVNQGCHPGGGAPMSLRRGVAFGNLIDVPSAFGKLKRVQPFESDRSVLYLKFIGDPKAGNLRHLDRSALTQQQIEAIKEWIDAGALNN